MNPLRFALMPALGEEFRSAREARGITLSDVAEQIHIRSVYLNAIENEDWKAIGAAVYVRGFIRTYARFLGLDAEDAVARFNLTAPPERSTAITTVTLDDDERSGPSLWVILGTLVALALVAFVAYEYWQYVQGPSTKAAVASATPAPQPTPTAPGSVAAAGASAPASGLPSALPGGSPGPSGRHRLEIRLTQRSWLRVTVDGTTQLEGIFPAGTSRTFSGNVADVRAGNAGGVTVAVDGRPPSPMGKEGDVVEQRFTL
jgi:cytoskeletal protein RodZ